MTTRSQLKVHPGGLFSCCLQSAQEWIEADPTAAAVPGEKFACKYERENPCQMIVDGDIIRWFDPDYPPLPGGWLGRK